MESKDIDNNAWNLLESQFINTETYDEESLSKFKNPVAVFMVRNGKISCQLVTHTILHIGKSWMYIKPFPVEKLASYINLDDNDIPKDSHILVFLARLSFEEIDALILISKRYYLSLIHI